MTTIQPLYARPALNAVRSERAGLLGWVFVLWVLLLPFSQLATTMLGTTAPDKVLGLVLLLVWVFRGEKLSPRRVRGISYFVSFAALFVLAKNLSFFSSKSLLYANVWRDSIEMGYFLLPVLYIRHVSDLRRVNNAIIIVAIIGFLSAFLVATGMISLPLARISDSRFGFELPKSVGLFSSYGDLAQFTSYLLLLTFFVAKPAYLGRLGNKGIKLLIIATAFLGFAASQSRNILITSMVAVMIGVVLNQMLKKKRNAASYVLLLSGILVAISLAVFFSSEISTRVATLGGGTGANTAAGRLEQWHTAIDIIVGSPLLGADAATFARYGPLIDGTHNMWLALAARGGLITIMVFVAILFRAIVGAVRTLGDAAAGREALVVCGYFVAMLLSTQFYPAQTSMYWALLGVAASVGCMSRMQPTEASARPRLPRVAQPARPAQPQPAQPAR